MKNWIEYISDEEAIKTIEDYPDQDRFIYAHLRQWTYGDQYCDNSIELAQLWTYCKSVYDDQP